MILALAKKRFHVVKFHWLFLSSTLQQSCRRKKWQLEKKKYEKKKNMLYFLLFFTSFFIHKLFICYILCLLMTHICNVLISTFLSNDLGFVTCMWILPWLKTLTKECCGLTPVGNYIPRSHLLTLPRWDGEEHQNDKSKRICKIKTVH